MNNDQILNRKLSNVSHVPTIHSRNISEFVMSLRFWAINIKDRKNLGYKISVSVALPSFKNILSSKSNIKVWKLNTSAYSSRVWRHSSG